MPDRDLAGRVRELFLTDDNTYGCAEVSLIALQESVSLPRAADASPAMALNGGIAYSGGTCGAITGTALALGRAVAAAEPDHATAKKTTRRLVQQLMFEFRERFGSTTCRDLTGYDLMRDHDAFIADATWQTECTAQLEFAVSRSLDLLRATVTVGTREVATDGHRSGPDRD